MKSFSAETLAALASGDMIASGAVWFGLEEALGFWGGHGDLTLSERTFQGIGDAGLVTVSGGSLGGKAEGGELSLSGVDANIAGAVDWRSLRGKPATIYRLIFNGTGARLLDASVYLRGRFDSASIVETPGGTATIKVGVEGPARGLGRRLERMHSDADQRLISETDGGMRRISYAGQKDIYWMGKVPVRAGSAFGGGNTNQGSGDAGRGGGLNDVFAA